MNTFCKVTTTLCAGLLAMQVEAATIVQCEDEFGSRSFQERCPPGSTVVDTREYGTRAGSPGGDQRPPITLYRVGNCDSCDQVKEFLDIRRIRYQQKDVGTDAALQEELKERAGELRVPVTVVGDDVISGYNRAQLLQSLESAGYETAENDEGPLPAEEQEAAEEETADVGGEEEQPADEEEPAAE